MIAAVPTTRPARASEVCTGCFLNRSIAMPKTSRLNMTCGAPVPRLAALRVDTEAVGQRDRTGKNDRVVLLQSAGDLRLVQAEQADLDIAAPRTPRVQDVDVAPLALPDHGRSRDQERPALLARHDLHVHGRVGRKAALGVRDLSENLADLPAAHVPQTGRHLRDLALPALPRQAVERKHHALAGGDAREIRLIHA